MRPLLIETRPAPVYCCLIGNILNQDELPWYHDIYQFLSCSAYPKSTSAKDKRALRKRIGLFHLGLTHPGSKSCTVFNSALLMLLIDELFLLIILWML